jgi:hypothetical protein
MKLISFATGNLYKFLNEIDTMSLIDSLGIEGIEYTYGKYYAERPITKTDKKILLKRKDISLHTPFKLLKFPENIQKDTLDFEKIIQDYKRVKAKRLVLHPDQILNKQILKLGKENNIQFITENLRKRHGNDKKKTQERFGFEKVLNEHKSFGLCLDVAHSYSWSPKETKDIVEKWEDKIMQVHFSVTHYKKEHLPLTKASKNFLNSIKCLRDLDVPIVIEEEMETMNKKWILKEIEQIKKLFE